MRFLTKTTFSLALASSLVLTGCGSSQNTAPAPSASSSNNVSAGAAQDQSQPSSTATSSKPAEGCLSGGPDVAKGETKGMKWEINPEGGRNLFSIDGAGPCSTGPGGLRTGYAHTAAGALAAALNYDAQISVQYPTKDTPARLKAALAPGTDADALQKLVKNNAEGVPDARAEAADQAAKVTKYQILPSSEDQVRVRYILTAPDRTAHYAATVDLKWLDGDWKIVPFGSQDWGSAEEISDESGYTELPKN